MPELMQFKATIDASLRKVGLHSDAACELLLGTALHESGGFKWKKQVGGGPGRGYFQMEKTTHDDIWKNYIEFRPVLKKK